MLQIIQKSFATTNLVETFIHHRHLEFWEENNLPSFLETDGYDEDGTFYLGYRDKEYGLIGSARLVPTQTLRPSLRTFFSSAGNSPPYTLIDCVFYIPTRTGFFKQEDDLMDTHYRELMTRFHQEIKRGLQTLCQQNQLTVVGVCLNEVEAKCLRQFGDVEIRKVKALTNPHADTDLILGLIQWEEG